MNQETKQTFFLSLILLLLLALLFMYWIKPKIELRFDRIDQLEEVKRQTADTNWRVKQMQQNGLVERFYIGATRRAVPEDARLPNLLHDARSLELISGIPFSTYDWKTDATPITVSAKTHLGSGNVQVIPVMLQHTFKANYDQLEKLLQEIEDMPRLMQVKQMSIHTSSTNPVSINDSAKDLNVEMVIEAYYAPALVNVVEKDGDELPALPRLKDQPFE